MKCLAAGRGGYKAIIRIRREAPRTAPKAASLGVERPPWPAARREDTSGVSEGRSPVTLLETKPRAGKGCRSRNSRNEFA